ncbi:MAG TPA: hypothetical protein VHV82_09435 [Sporichthyaceae bacterium]|nr:hypothetical protein [Sporichthyaceae bacterium]
MRTTDIIRIPLGSGVRGDPAQGASLLELAGVLSESRWTDRPATVHPTLAVLAHTVGDRLGPQGARLAVVFAPWLCATRAKRPAAMRAVVLTCVNTALPYAEGRLRTGLLRTVQRSTEQLATPEPDRRRLQQAWCGGRESRVAALTVRRAVRVVADVLPPGATHDEELLGLLEDCINAARAAAGRPPVHPRLPRECCPDHIDVVTGWISHPVTGERVRSYRPLDLDWGNRLAGAAGSAALTLAPPLEAPRPPSGRIRGRISRWLASDPGT